MLVKCVRETREAVGRYYSGRGSGRRAARRKLGRSDRARRYLQSAFSDCLKLYSAEFIARPALPSNDQVLLPHSRRLVRHAALPLASISRLNSCSQARSMSLFNVSGKKAVVTGGGSGLGSYIAKALAAEGATVYIVGRRAEKLKEVAATAGEYSHAAAALAQLCTPSLTAFDDGQVPVRARSSREFREGKDSDVVQAAHLYLNSLPGDISNKNSIEKLVKVRARASPRLQLTDSRSPAGIRQTRKHFGHPRQRCWYPSGGRDQVSS